jgi:hypothetical protein
VTKAKALKVAQAKWGAKGYVRMNRRVTWNEAGREKARVELKEHRTWKPVRPDNLYDGKPAISVSDRDFWLARFRAWRKEEERLMTIALSHRYDVGILSNEIGFAMFSIRGSGDTWEQALERAGVLCAICGETKVGEHEGTCIIALRSLEV